MRFGPALAVALAGLSIALPAASPHPLHGLWTPLNATFAPPPVMPDGLALRTQTLNEPTGLLGFGAVGVRLPDGAQIGTLEALSVDTFYETGGCGGGSPRFQLGVDTDGDGVSNGNVHVYAGQPPSFSGCTLGAWSSNDLLDGALRFDSTQLGGPFFGTQASAHNAAGPGHEILSISFVWDSTWLFGPSILWADNIVVKCFELGEPQDFALSLVQGQMDCP